MLIECEVSSAKQRDLDRAAAAATGRASVKHRHAVQETLTSLCPAFVAENPSVFRWGITSRTGLSDI